MTESETNQINLSKTYSPTEVEKKIYDSWLNDRDFSNDPESNRDTYSLVMPPPNVTGKLHMGHALDNLCQDILVRYQRMLGKDVLWIPGADHAGIATQAVVEKLIYKESGKTKHDLGREAFVEEIWKWKEKFESEIKNQLYSLGVSCNWDYFTFTLDKIPNLAVKRFFKTLFDQGLIYKDRRIINWDTTLQSAISDAEVEHKEIKGNFYHIHYQVKDSNEKLEIATTRPETLYGDTAVAVHPEDERFRHLIGKKAIVPLIDREVPIIGDEYVDRELGTGCLKVTPAHDFNDFEIGKRHDLEFTTILNKDGSLNEIASPVVGLSVQAARKETIKLLEEKNLLVSTQKHTHQVAHGERSDSIIEPMVSDQWFVNVQGMAKQSVDSIRKEKSRFVPKTWENTFFSWMEEPRDWCVSRQLWWGHQIPVFTCGSCEHVFASEEDNPDCESCGSSSITQDPDVLDTWFSSALWPMSTLGWPCEQTMAHKNFDRYFPNNVLVTGFDIIFFWVARMMMSGLKLQEIEPFQDIYIHALVRDKNGQKMSKSLGNGIDPLEMVEKYGCDALRYTLASGAGHNRGINLDEANIEIARNFINKIWNAFRFSFDFIKDQDDLEITQVLQLNLDSQEKWILKELAILNEHCRKNIENYRFDEASLAIHHFVYDKFCSWFIELSKSVLYGNHEQKRINRAKVLKFGFETILKIMQPLMPFISQEIWSHLRTGPEAKKLIHESYPSIPELNEFAHDCSLINHYIKFVTEIRNLRARVQVSPKEPIEISAFTGDSSFAQFIHKNRKSLQHLANVSKGQISSLEQERPKKCIFSATDKFEVFLKLEGLIDIEEEIERVKKQIHKATNDLQKHENKLNNSKFVDNAPEDVVDEVKKKADGLRLQINSFRSNLEVLKQD